MHIPLSLSLTTAVFALLAFNVGLAPGAPRYEYEHTIANPEPVASSNYFSASSNYFYAVAVDTQGEVLATRPNSGTIRVFSSAATGNEALDDKTITKPGPGPFVPTGIAVSKTDGRVYVADSAAKRVLVYKQVAGKYVVAKQIDLSAYALNSIAVDVGPDNRLYVSIADKSDNDSLNRIMVFLTDAPSGNYPVIGCFAAGFFYKPVAIAHDAANNTYVIDSMKEAHQRVVVFAPYAGIDLGCDPQKKDDDPQYLGSIGAEGSGPGQFNSPLGLAIDKLGRVHASDAGNNRVQAFTPVEGAWSYLARYPEPTLGQTGIGGGSGPAELKLPVGMAIDGTRIYVADSGNSRLQRLRFDDADADGVFDAEDNCPSVANPDQAGSVPGGPGDACPANNPSGDGSQAGSNAASGDRTPPQSRILRPGAKRSGHRSLQIDSFRTVGGRASDRSSGVARVDLAIGRVKGHKCRWLTRKRALKGKCAKPKFVKARVLKRGSTTKVRWTYRLSKSQRRALRSGKWQLLSRATDRAGNFEKGRKRNRNLRTLQLSNHR